MTNEQIVLDAQLKLMKEGKIQTTGRTMICMNMAGEEVLVPEPEAIHTYQVWKSMGYQVQKGQKAIVALQIWKHVTKVDEETEEETSRMFMKTASFFARHQVEQVA